MADPVVLYLNLRRTHLEHGAALEAAHRQGYGVVLIADSVPPGLPRGIVRAVHQVDTYDAEAVDAAVTKVCAEHELAGVMTWSDRDVESVSRIAARLGLPAPSPEAARIARNKYLMREALAAHPDTIPRYAKVSDWESLVKAAAEIGYPAVLKPTSASGSKGIFVLRGEDDLEPAYGELIRYTRPEVDRVFSGNPNELIIEQFLEGTEHSVEGFVHNGEVFIAGVTDKQTTEPFRLELAHVFPSALPEPALAAVHRLTRTVIEAIGLDNCAFHLECMVSGNSAKLVEVAARVGGDFITSHLVGMATGRSFAENAVQVATGQRPELTTENVLHAGVHKIMAERGGVFAGLDGLAQALAVPGVRHIVVERAAGAEVALPPEDYMSSTLGAVLATGDSAESVRNTLQTAVGVITPRFEQD